MTATVKIFFEKLIAFKQRLGFIPLLAGHKDSESGTRSVLQRLPGETVGPAAQIGVAAAKLLHLSETGQQDGC